MGSVLSLVSELVQTPQLRSSLLAYLDLICNTTKDILAKAADKSAEHAEKLEESAATERQDTPKAGLRPQQNPLKLNTQRFGEQEVFISTLTLLHGLLKHASDVS